MHRMARAHNKRIVAFATLTRTHRPAAGTPAQPLRTQRGEREVHAYFLENRKRQDRARIEERWILQAVTAPPAEQTQSDGRIRRWVYVEEEQR